MRRLKVVAICAAVVLAIGSGLWVLDRAARPHGTGEPEWRFPETYVDHPDGSQYITLDEDGVARVGDIPNRDSSCAATSEKNITGQGTWEATTYGLIHIEVGDRVLLVGSGVYRGELDWGRLMVALCVNDVEGDFVELFHTGYIMGS